MWQFASITSWALWFFEHIDISQGSVVTYLRCGGIFKYGLLQIYHWVCQWKNFESQLTLGEAVGTSLVSCFLAYSVYQGMLINGDVAPETIMSELSLFWLYLLTVIY